MNPFPVREGKTIYVGVGNSATADDYVVYGKVTSVSLLADGRVLQFTDDEGLLHWVSGDWNIWEEE